MHTNFWDVNFEGYEGSAMWQNHLGDSESSWIHLRLRNTQNVNFLRFSNILISRTEQRFWIKIQRFQKIQLHIVWDSDLIVYPLQGCHKFSIFVNLDLRITNPLNFCRHHEVFKDMLTLG